MKVKTPKWIPVGVVQGGNERRGWTTIQGREELRRVELEQARYLVQVWGGITAYYVRRLLPVRMKDHLRRLALYAREHGKPCPDLDGILFSKGTWKVITGGILLAKTVPIWLDHPTLLKDAAIRVRLS